VSSYRYRSIFRLLAGPVVAIGIIVAAPFAIAVNTFTPPYFSASSTTTTAATGSGANTYSTNSPSASAGTWVTWGQSKTTNVGTADLILLAKFVSPVFAIHISSVNAKTSWVWTGAEQLSTPCVSSSGTATAETDGTVLINLLDSTTGATVLTFNQPTYTLFSHSISGCYKTWSTSQSGFSWVTTYYTFSNLVTTNNYQILAFFQIHTNATSTNDGVGIACADFMTNLGSCSGTSATGTVALSSFTYF
jgi:hypothetical protein